MRLVALSDTHNRHREFVVPAGDVLVHAGDATLSGRIEELGSFLTWFGSLPHRRKLLVAGNHDWLFEREPGLARQLVTGAIDYLQDATVVIDGVRFWGSPWQPWFLDWAFNLKTAAELARVWAQIPRDTDVLITHGPPYGILDLVEPQAVSMSPLGPRDAHAGCHELLSAVRRVRPRLHVFGHIHEGYGQEQSDGTHFVNASNCDARYRPINPPIVVDL